MSFNHIHAELGLFADPVRAESYQKFFKTGKGEYGEGDCFLGVIVPQIRKIVKKYRDSDDKTIITLLHSKFHEERMSGLLIIADRFARADDDEQRALFELYCAYIDRVNNWDLVDVTVPHVIGMWLVRHTQEIGFLITLAKSSNVWHRRIAIISTSMFIKNGIFEHTIYFGLMFLHDPHDLIHKAVGWMLREVGKKDMRVLQDFLDQHYQVMPRTMLRYAIEKMPALTRAHYMTR